jgi:hypothetical protein
MAMIKQTLIATLVMGMVALSACVTINIYFPAAAAEKAADKIIDEVWQLKQQEDAEKVPATDKPADTPAAPVN